MVEESILKKIRALFRKSEENGASPAEAQAALKKAQNLMEKHGIEEDSVVLQESEEESAERITETKTAPYSSVRWQRDLAGVVNVVCNTKSYESYTKGEKDHEIHFVGMAKDVEVAKALYTSLLNTILRNAYEAYGKPSPTRRSYCVGFVDQLYINVRGNRLTDRTREVREQR